MSEEEEELDWDEEEQGEEELDWEDKPHEADKENNEEPAETKVVPPVTEPKSNPKPPVPKNSVATKEAAAEPVAANAKLSKKSTNSSPSAEKPAEEKAPAEEEPAKGEVTEGDKFVVGCEGKQDMTEEERKVEYQAALSTVLLGELQSTESGVVAMAARKLDDFFQTKEHAVHTDCFCALGGHGLLLMLLQKWQDDQNIQERLFSCLANLCQWARNNDAKVLSTILIMRGMDLIAGSMKRFPGSSTLYVDCLVTITCLCRKEELDRHATTRSSITGAVPLVCKAIKAFPENRDVLHSGCRALKAFCEMKLDQIKDLKGEAISVVGASLQNFPDDKEINKIAFSFLFNLGSMCGYGADAQEEVKEEKKEEKQEEKAAQPPAVVKPPLKKWPGALN